MTYYREVRKELVEFLTPLLKEHNVQYSLWENGGRVKCATNLSSRKYHEYIEAAMCKKQQGKKRTAVVSYETYKRRHVRRNRIILEKDTSKFLQAVM